MKKARSKRKFEEIDISDDDRRVRPESKKLLKIIETASGAFVEEPMTPEKKNKHAFQGNYRFLQTLNFIKTVFLINFQKLSTSYTVTPLTPVNQSFRVQKQILKEKSNKRKSIYISEDDPLIDELLPKPKWKINTQFAEHQPRKRARKLEVGSTEVVVKSLEPKKKSKPTIPEDIRLFRHRQMYRSDIPREDKRALLRQQYKKRSNFH